MKSLHICNCVDGKRHHHFFRSFKSLNMYGLQVEVEVDDGINFVFLKNNIVLIHVFEIEDCGV